MPFRLLQWCRVRQRCAPEGRSVVRGVVGRLKRGRTAARGAWARRPSPPAAMFFSLRQRPSCVSAHTRARA